MKIAPDIHQRFHYRTLEELQEEIAQLGLELPFDRDLSILAEPVQIGRWRAPNRFAVHPMEGFDAGIDGAPGELTFRRYRRYAAGGSGLIWFEATAVMAEARSNPRQLFIHRGNLDSFKRLVEETRRAARAANGHEPVLVLQLTHSGRYSRPAGEPAPIIAHHSPILDPIHGLSPDYPLVSDEYLDRLQEVFLEAAGLAAQAGFDGVDIKSCHRYLLSELLASFTREGKYGGSFENRTRMLRETVARVAASMPGIFVTVRLNMYDGIPYPYGWGVSREETKTPDLHEPLALVGELVKLGIPLLNVTVGNPYYNPHLNRPYDFPIAGMNLPDEHPLVGVARFVTITRTIQEAYPRLPVVASGYSWLRHLMPYLAAGVIRTGGATMVGQGRGAFAYPDSVRDILEKGRMDPAKCCITCSACTQIMRDGMMTGCVVRDSGIYGPQYRLARRFAQDRLKEEARRCRDCLLPTCVEGCPAGIEIPRFLKAFALDDLPGAYEVLRRANALPETCARLCPVEVQCEGNCLERIFCGQPVAIRDVQLAVAERARRLGLVGLRLPAGASGHDVAVVGGGPAGLACAIKLLEAGHAVTLYEKEDRLGGVPDNLIPAARFGDSRDEVEAILSPALTAGRLKLALGHALGREVSLEELRKNHAAVFLAMGLGAGVSLGEGEGVVDAWSFLARMKRGEDYSLEGLAVAVIGGGSTAVDASLSAKRLGAADVYLVYRRSYLEMPAWEEDRRALLVGGVHPLFLLQPLGYEIGDGRVVGVRLARVRLGPADAGGRRRPEIVPGSESVLRVDMVIEALGQEISPEVKAALGPLVAPAGDRVLTLPGSSATSISGVFAGGDLTNGGQTVVRAVAEGMRAAEEIDAYLRRSLP